MPCHPNHPCYFAQHVADWRRAGILKRWRKGRKQVNIAKYFNISDARVNQILKSEILKREIPKRKILKREIQSKQEA